MDSYDLDIHPILDEELYNLPPLMPVVVAKLQGTHKDIPKAFRLTKSLVTSEFKHLRRIKNQPNGDIECVITKCKTGSDDERCDELKAIEEMFAEEELLQDFRIEHVPSTAPRTDHQLKACAKVWPCKFAKSNYLIQCIEGSVFSEAEKLVIKTIVNKLLDYIKNQPVEKLRTGAVIFRCAKVYGVGLCDQEKLIENPSKHAPMLSIDSVAQNAGAGHWMKSVEEGQLLQSIQEELDKQEVLSDHRIDANFLPYLCTNYDVFAMEEPCMMCSMGLIQSRIRRLFYLDRGSLAKLKTSTSYCYSDKAIEQFHVHLDRSLNHRFEAWKVGLIDDR